MWRVIPADLASGVVTSLRETNLRFPAAPIHGIHRVHQDQRNLPNAENFHTMRLLRSADANEDEAPSSIYLLHNGLNELDRFTLYYQLASLLIRDDSSAACIVRPFPGHLTRFPYQWFSEKPLDRFLVDGSELFRQFIRYMIETQWLLSILVTRSRYRCASGAVLLAPHEMQRKSRLEDEVIAAAIHSEWTREYEASQHELKNVLNEQTHAPQMKEAISTDAVLSSVQELRTSLGWYCYKKHGGEPPDSGLDLPTIHVVGYSLGGFTAQSVFMTWPFAIASCSTLLAGGALRELSPTAFAHPEEWQTVLHSLRYELDYAMVQGRLSERSQRIAGVQRDVFIYLQRTFYEVFEQEYRGSYRTRLSEYGRRMLFVVGGHDPIVRPRSVLDSAPEEGVNMIEIAGLGHFLGHPAREDSLEDAQRRFWLPEVAGLLGRFGDKSAKDHQAELANSWLTTSLNRPYAFRRSRRKMLKRLSEEETIAIEQDGSMSSPLFERCLDDLVARVQAGEGFLFILRNEVPAALLNDVQVQRRAQALHHDDANILQYWEGVHSRSAAVADSLMRTTIVLPEVAERLQLTRDAPHGFPSQSETAVGQLPRARLQNQWTVIARRIKSYLATAPGSVLAFEAGKLTRATEPLRTAAAKRAGARNDEDTWVTTLPDCWIWVGEDALGLKANKEPAERKRVIDKFQEVAAEAKSKSSPFPDLVKQDRIRIISVSRARFNPRFRGRVVVDQRGAMDMFLHAAVCLAESTPFTAERLETNATRKVRRPPGIAELAAAYEVRASTATDA